MNPALAGFTSSPSSLFAFRSAQSPRTAHSCLSVAVHLQSRERTSRAHLKTGARQNRCPTDHLRTGCPNIELGHLPLKRSGHHLLAQTLEAIQLRLHQRSAEVAAPAFPDGTTQSLAYFDCLIAMGEYHSFRSLAPMHVLRVIRVDFHAEMTQSPWRRGCR